MSRWCLVLLLVIACSEPIDEDCNPLLGEEECLLPYPSDFFRVEDEELPSGYRIAIEGAAEPSGYTPSVDRARLDADVTNWRPIDGYSRSPLIVAALGPSLSTNGLVQIADPPDASVAEDTRTLLIEAESGTRIPHFVDVDQELLVLHPRVKLTERTRYVVALRDIESEKGRVIEAPAGFVELPQTLRGRYEEEIFPVLEQAGVAREELQLAWDFTTGSDEHVTRDMLRVRALTMEHLAATPPVVEVERIAVPPEVDEELWFEMRARVTAPLFLDDTAQELARDDDGDVEVGGTLSVPFIVLVPSNLRDSPDPGRVIVYGHGFFNSADIAAPFLVSRAYDLRSIIVLVDWFGMSDSDRDFVARDLALEPSVVLRFADRVHQGMANWLTVTTAIQTAFPEIPQLQREGGRLIVDPEQMYFLGASLGHIFGSILVSLDPRIRGAALEVGGGGWTHMMQRSWQFNDFLDVMRLPLPDRRARQKYIATLQRHFDRIDPLTYVEMLRDEGPPVLIQVALGDSQVPNHTSFLYAHTLGVELTPAPIEVWGLDTMTGTVSSSGMTLFDFGVDRSFEETFAPPADDNGVHGRLPLLDATIHQNDVFFREGGKVINPCSPTCIFE